MKAAVVVVLIAALLFAYQASGQEPAPVETALADLGETNLLLLACAYATEKAEAEGVAVRYCRRHEPEQVDAYKARVTVKVGTDVGRFLVRVDFRKSLWWASGFGVAPG